MEIRKWTTVDVHYFESEQDAADEERKRLERMGYQLQERDNSGNADYDYCDQYIKNGRTITRQLTPASVG